MSNQSEADTVPEMHFDGTEIDSVRIVGARLNPNSIGILFRDHKSLTFEPRLDLTNFSLVSRIKGKAGTWSRVGEDDSSGRLNASERLELEERRSVMAEITGMGRMSGEGMTLSGVVLRYDRLVERIRRVHLRHVSSDCCSEDEE